MKKFLSVLLTLALLLSLGLVLASCEKKAEDPGHLGMQLEKPAAGEEIGIITTSMGVIKVRFFPENAPKTVKNFKDLAKEGWFNNKIFHRVINDFMIQAGGSEQNPNESKSIYGDKFDNEFSKNLINIRGSLAMANAGLDSSGNGTNSSQFFINQAGPDKISWSQLETYFSNFRQDSSSFGTYGVVDFNKVTDEYRKLYNENGGNANLDGYYNANKKSGHTVFAQVFEGMDVVDAIAAVKTVSKTISEGSQPVDDMPETTVFIEKIELEAYKN